MLKYCESKGIIGDFDSDTMLITDNELLISAAKRNYKNFPVPTCKVSSMKRERHYCSSDKADLDISTSVNKIGEIVNLSQELNTLMWDKLYRGEKIADVRELYGDICKLAVLSGIEIDKAKKEYQLDSTREISIIKNKWCRFDESGRAVKPNFFGHLAKEKGYYNTQRKNYLRHHTTMDYVQRVMHSHLLPRLKWDGKSNEIPFITICDEKLYKNGAQKYLQIAKILEFTHQMNKCVKNIYINKELSSEEKFELMNEEYDKLEKKIDSMSMSASTMYFLLKELDKDENKPIVKTLFRVLFSSENSAFMNLIKENERKVGVLTEDENGFISLFGTNYAVKY